MALYDPLKGRRKIYKYDKVFGIESTQQEVYEDTKALIRSVLDGMLPFQDFLAAPSFTQLRPHLFRLSNAISS